jgi:hypothetical protein
VIAPRKLLVDPHTQVFFDFRMPGDKLTAKLYSRWCRRFISSLRWKYSFALKGFNFNSPLIKPYLKCPTFASVLKLEKEISSRHSQLDRPQTVTKSEGILRRGYVLPN